MNILFVTAILPHRRDTGGALFSQSLIDLLRESGAEVRAVGWQGLDAREASMEGMVGRRAFVTRQHPWAALGWGLRALATRQPFTSAKFRDRRFDRAVLAQREWTDVVVINDELGWMLDLIPPDKKFVHVSHQIASKLYRQKPRHPIFAREARLLEAIEHRLALKADQIWTIAPDDADEYRRLGAQDVRYLPYAPEAPAAPEDSVVPRYDFVLLGTWTWAPNRAGLDWFIGQVLPRLGDQSVAIAGRGSRDYSGASPNLHALGEVPDALGFLRSGRAILIPSTAGVGLQTKTLTALSAGRPIVATSLALRHIEERAPHLFIEDGPAGFAAAAGKALQAEVAIGDILRGRRETYKASVLQALADLARRGSRGG